jgi:hypothetical protein
MMGSISHSLLAIDQKNLNNILSLQHILIKTRQGSKNTINMNQMKDHGRLIKLGNPEINH